MAKTSSRVALVTGAGRGIGRAIASELAKAEWEVVLIARTTSEINEVRKDLQQQGLKAHAYACDVTSSLDVDLLEQRIAKDVGVVTLLVNNAGVAPSEKLENTDDDLWHRTIATNLTGPFYLSRAFVPAMKKQGGGEIINIASTAAMDGFAYTAAYTASKHGVLGLTRALAKELERSKIRVNAICPGFVRTSIVETSVQNITAKTGKSAEEAEAELAKFNKEGRLLEPQEIAETVLLLLNSATYSGKAFDSSGVLLD
ncbi:MAG TPA: SDR family oxidoreductase [Candidatus Kapabacteria bacterium]|jgi:NAD(P)-dependent dehydrogenase (short-subunit alcohol dehydrogenase family)|nr:SDR family oxidoreductase [Candidatus Kapabacteria bacterium]